MIDGIHNDFAINSPVRQSYDEAFKKLRERVEQPDGSMWCERCDGLRLNWFREHSRLYVECEDCHWIAFEECERP